MLLPFMLKDVEPNKLLNIFTLQDKEYQGGSNMLQDIHGKTIRLNGTVLGFAGLDRFEFTLVEENSPFGYMQSLENRDVCFVVASPFSFFQSYEFCLDQEEVDSLALKEAEDTLVLGIITLHKPFRRSTMNLVAPLVINIQTLQGRQILLASQSEYSTKAALFAHSEQGEDTAKC